MVMEIPAEVPADIVEAAEKVSSWFKERGLSRWTVGGCADQAHYESLKVQSKLVIDCCTSPGKASNNTHLDQRIDELDNLIRGN